MENNTCNRFGIIYSYRNKVNGKYYIGQTLNPHERKLAHKRASKKYAFHNAINKYGWDNFKYEVIVTAPIQLLNDLEINIIHMYDSYNNGYNMTIGGDSFKGYVFTEAHRLNISKGKKDKPLSEKTKENLRNRVLSESTKKKISDSKKGKPLSKEHKQKLSIASRGRVVTQEHREKLRNLHLGKGDNYVITNLESKEEWFVTSGITRWCKERGLCASALRQVALGVTQQHKKYTAKIVERVLLNQNKKD